MTLNMTTILLAAGSGATGALIGGTEAFIIYGFVLMFRTALFVSGHDMTGYDLYAADLFFLPAVMFNGAVAATAYASRKYDIHEWETDRSLGFTHDPLVLAVGACAAVTGYLIFSLANYVSLPLDTGAFTVVTVGVLVRLMFRRKWISLDAVRSLRDVKLWIWNLTTAALCASVTAFFVKETGIVTLGFMLSAASLMLQLFPRTESAPTTHQITMVAGLAVLASGSIAAAVLFGMLAQVIFIVFTGFFNLGCGSHLDSPAVAIMVCSLLIRLIF